MATDWNGLATPDGPRSRRGAVTRQRLIVTAAELFAEHGIGGVSPQEILQASDQHNSSAIQYHFGSLEGLVRAVLDPRHDLRDPIDAERTALLDELLSSAAPITLEGAVRAYLLPGMRVLRTPEGRAFARVAAQVLRTLTLDERVAAGSPSEGRAIGAIVRAMPALPERVRTERLGVMRTLHVELVANRARELSHGIEPHLPEEDFTRELQAMLIGLLRAPVADALRMPGEA